MQEYFNDKFSSTTQDSNEKFDKVMKQQEESDTRRDQIFSEFKVNIRQGRLRPYFDTFSSTALVLGNILHEKCLVLEQS